MPITGVHAIFYSRRAEEVQAFLRDTLGLASVDAGEHWPIFAGPPLELAVHPSDDEPKHELYLMCDDVAVFTASLAARGIETSPVTDQGWGLLTEGRLPGGETIGLYEPKHPSPIAAAKTPQPT